MLRIRKIVDSPSETTLRLEGKVRAEWVAVLEEECGKVLRETRRVRLDLAAVDFVDPRGVTLLRRLAADRVTIVSAAVYIQTLLTAEKHSGTAGDQSREAAPTDCQLDAPVSSTSLRVTQRRRNRSLGLDFWSRGTSQVAGRWHG